MIKDRLKKFKNKLKFSFRNKYFDLLNKNQKFKKIINSNFDKYKNTYLDFILQKKDDSKAFLSKLFESDYLIQSIKSLAHKKNFDNIRPFVSKYKTLITEKIFINRFNIQNQAYSSSDLTLLPPPPIWSRIFIWTLGTGSITLIFWSVFTTVEETIILTGELTTITPEVKISAMDPGRITQVLVKSNQYVKKNTILLMYEDDETSARLNSAKNRFEYSQNQRINLIDSYNIKLDQLNYQIKFKEDIADRYKKLFSTGAISEIRYLESLSELEQLKSNYESTLIEKDNVLYQNSEQLEQLSTLILELEAKTNRFNIVSPVSGFIQNIKYQSPGERIMANDVVITVVPDNELIVKASIPSKVSAPIQAGMEAIVEVDAFPSDDFGGIIAEVFTISPTVSTDTTSGGNRRTYIAEIKLISPEIPGKFSFDELRSGMAISTKIKLRDKPIIASAFNIISDIFDPLAEQR